MNLFSQLTSFVPFKNFVRELNDTFCEDQFSLTSSEIKKPRNFIAGNPRDILPIQIQ